ncbi:hypothetical protein [Pelosinus baikalensis]|uniref:Uncharacterized protein n=1 Tax=Pelosinus baikalensis TaxID=2892015 RepID=A0ABS8HY90_9FIRM|nr:hypothetical protein [Pelosinus baikalensis]MCC5468148.1 hypothetical protein [Pelosinus baikalensis]
MYTIIHGIPVMADPALPREEINALISDLIQTWTWEGRQLGKVELVSDGQLIHVCCYEKPSIQYFPLKSNKSEV